jgi:hypothetical protein
MIFPFATSINDTVGAPVNIFTNFCFPKKIEMAPMVYSGAFEKLVHGDNPKFENLTTLSL